MGTSPLAPPPACGERLSIKVDRKEQKLRNWANRQAKMERLTEGARLVPGRGVGGVLIILAGGGGDVKQAEHYFSKALTVEGSNLCTRNLICKVKTFFLTEPTQVCRFSETP